MPEDAYQALETTDRELAALALQARRHARMAIVLTSVSLLCLLVGVVVPGWSGFGGVSYTDSIESLSYRVEVTGTLSMAWGHMCLELETPNITACPGFPAPGECLTGGANSLLMGMCSCNSLCPPKRGADKDDMTGIHPVPFCNGDTTFLAFIYPSIGTMAILMVAAMLEVIGIAMAIIATRNDHLIVQTRIGCCRVAQAAFSLFSVAAVFQGLGIVNYLVQREGEINVCEGGATLSFPIGYGIILVFVSWMVLAVSCHYCKLARDIQEEEPVDPAVSLDK